jgi:hypothetical protein
LIAVILFILNYILEECVMQNQDQEPISSSELTNALIASFDCECTLDVHYLILMLNKHDYRELNGLQMREVQLVLGLGGAPCAFNMLTRDEQLSLLSLFQINRAIGADACASLYNLFTTRITSSQLLEPITLTVQIPDSDLPDKEDQRQVTSDDEDERQALLENLNALFDHDDVFDIVAISNALNMVKKAKDFMSAANQGITQAEDRRIFNIINENGSSTLNMKVRFVLMLINSSLPIAFSLLPCEQLVDLCEKFTYNMLYPQIQTQIQTQTNERTEDDLQDTEIPEPHQSANATR